VAIERVDAVAGRVGVGDGGEEGREVAELGLSGIGEVLVDPAIVGVEEEDPAGGLAVAPGPPDLLVVSGDRTRHVDVDHVAQIALVDAHAEGVARRDRGEAAAEEVVLEGALVLVEGGAGSVVSSAAWAGAASGPWRRGFWVVDSRRGHPSRATRRAARAAARARDGRSGAGL
jgi:hypothetical protein